MLSLDTHILVFSLTDTLTTAERAKLRSHPWSISAIVLWELAMLVQRGRIGLDLDSRDVVRVLSKIHVWPLDLAICRQSCLLDFKGDPADELIAATSIVHGIPLMTRDASIRKSKLVTFA